MGGWKWKSGWWVGEVEEVFVYCSGWDQRAFMDSGEEIELAG